MFLTPKNANPNYLLIQLRCRTTWLCICFVFALCLFSSNLRAQSVTIDVEQAPLKEVMKQIEKQTQYTFFYKSSLTALFKPVSLHCKNLELYAALVEIFKQEELDFRIVNKTITVTAKESKKEKNDVDTLNIDVYGIIQNEKGDGVLAKVSVAGTFHSTFSDENGHFVLTRVPSSSSIIVEAVNIESVKVSVRGRSDIGTITVATRVNELDETIVRAYGSTSKRLNTGNITKVSSAEIEKQPVGNVLAALEGRVPGVNITQTSGVPGAYFKVQIRGRSSLDLNLSKNDPLYIIDGVPFESANQPINQLTSAANNPNASSEGGFSPLSLINPTDIQSIEILKDADATAIYGSRGANGVILITTKKGNTGPLKVSLNVYSGSSKPTRVMKMMNTSEYLQMRREAFKNDGIIPDATNAPDLILWDTTRNNDYANLLFGNIAHTYDAQLSLSGGNNLTSFLVAAGYHRESTVFSSDLFNQRISVNSNLSHQSPNKKLKLSLATIYSNSKDECVAYDISQYLRLPPNLKLYDSLGNINWQDQGVDFSGDLTNPLAQLLNQYHSRTNNLSSNLNVRFELVKGLTFNSNFGYNFLLNDEHSINPGAAYSPSSGTTGTSNFATSKSSSWIAEPQLEYNLIKKYHHFSALIGSTLQQRTLTVNSISGSNYSSDLLLNSIAAAGALSASNFSSEYKYAALFGRLSYNYDGKYLANFSLRRDASSRFGPDKRESTFGAIGVGWIFTNEKFVSALHWLSFGKIRGSYGITGNDQIGDYKFYDLWNPTVFTYQNSGGVFPTGLFNPNYSWERNKKMEAGIELGFIQDKILISASYYNQRSGNQLTNYTLPIQTGFSTVVKNTPALVENSGWELTFSEKIVDRKSLSWRTGFNLTIPKNRLIDFPGLSNSSYASSYVIGEPLTVVRRYHFLGVDPQTGIYQYEDVNKDGLLTTAGDYKVVANREQQLFGGFSNDIRFNGWELDFLFQFVKQTGYNYLNNYYNFIPGGMYNQPQVTLSRWMNPGDVSPIQQYTTLRTSPAAAAAIRLYSSDAIYSDASFIRLKNISLNYSLPEKWLRYVHAKSLKLSLNMQNLFTITRYKGADPETQSSFQVPPLRTIAFNISSTF